MRLPQDPGGPATAPPSRRDFLALGVGLLFVSAVPSLAGMGRKLVRRTSPVMGTIAEIGVVHADSRHAHRAIAAAIQELEWVDRTMSRFSAESDVGRANALAALEHVRIDEATALVLGAALQWAGASGGRFDPALGRVSALWDVGGRVGRPPKAVHHRFGGAELHKQVMLSHSAGGPRVRFGTTDVGLDLGGIAKGYAVDRAVGRLRDHGVEDGLVNVGGDLYALGLRPDGEPWRVGVRDPSDPEGLVVTLDATDQAIATSGDYVRGFKFEGRRYHHILNPLTAGPAVTSRRSLTVTAGTCMEADAAATAAFGVTGVSARDVVRLAGSHAAVLHSI